MSGKKIVRYSILTILIISLSVGAAFLIHRIRNGQDNNEAGLVFYNGRQYRYRDDIETFLIIGLDDRDAEEEDIQTLNELNRNSSQSDFLLLAVFDNTAETYTIIQINRDTMVQMREYDTQGRLNGLVTKQIALSHTYGTDEEESCGNTIFAVSRFLYDAQIDNYITVTMDAVPVLNDLVGGIDVPVEDNFEGVDNTLAEGETVHLEGEHALIYIRARRDMADDDTNEARMRRQHTYLSALKNALTEAFRSNPFFAFTAYNAVSDYTYTSLHLYQIPFLAYKFANYDFEGLVTPEGVTTQGEDFSEFHADDNALRELIISTFYEPV